MNKETKITLSAKEQELVCNTDWILTKHAIIRKVYHLFGEQAALMQELVLNQNSYLPEEVKASVPKIAKGENYKELPYVMLDYPRCFEKEKTVAIRTFFWWGHFFSVNLQLSGICKEKALPSLQNNFLQLHQNDYWLCVSSDPWQHHFEEDNYVAIKKYTNEEFSSILNRESFIKIGKKIPLTEWGKVPAFIEQSFTEMILLLKN
jgi:hypothetical protein